MGEPRSSFLALILVSVVLTPKTRVGTETVSRGQLMNLSSAGIDHEAGQGRTRKMPELSWLSESLKGHWGSR